MKGLPSSIIEAAQAKRSRLRDLAREYARIVREEIEEGLEEARRLVLNGLPSPAGATAHGAEDGGSGVIDFEHFTFYGVQAWAGAYRVGPGGSLEPAGEVRAADVGIVLPAGADEVRTRFYREILEAWAAEQVVGAVAGGIFFWDGSITPLIAGRRPWSETSNVRARRLAEEAARRLGVAPDELPSLVGECHERSPLCVQGLLEERGVSLGGRGADHLWVSYLEWLEKLEAVRRFLQAAFRSGVWPVFVTKTSRSKSLIGKAFPDVFYLARATGREVFYTRPRRRCTAIEVMNGTESERKDLVRRLLPEPYSGFYADEVAVVDLYARLARGENIIRIEIAAPSREVCLGDPGSIGERVLSLILAAPTRRGYPYALLLAHRRASISRDELARAARILGLGAERSGREMLS